jgi:hypothetical protein
MGNVDVFCSYLYTPQNMASLRGGLRYHSVRKLILQFVTRRTVLPTDFALLLSVISSGMRRQFLECVSAAIIPVPNNYPRRTDFLIIYANCRICVQANTDSVVTRHVWIDHTAPIRLNLLWPWI